MWCKDEGSRFFTVTNWDYLGVWACKQEACQKQAQDWLSDNTVSHSDLLTEFGGWVYVIRNNGKKESGWSIQGDAYREVEEGPYWILVKDKHHRSKCVTLDKLRYWND